MRGKPIEQDAEETQADEGDIPVGDTPDQTDETPDMENNEWLCVSANATATVANATLLDHGIINNEDTT